MRKYSGKAPGGWGPGSPNRTFAIFLVSFFALIAAGVWWNVSRVAANREAAAAAAPRMECTFAQWCVDGDCARADPPTPFLIITQGAFGRAYLRMEDRGGQIRGVFSDERDPSYWRQYVQWSPDRGEITVNLTEALSFDFVYDLQDGQEADIATASATGSGQCIWIVEEEAQP